MQKRILWLVLLLFLSACGEGAGHNEEYPYGHYEDQKMMGTVWEFVKNENSLIIDISEWEKRDRKGAVMTDEGYSYTAQLSKETLIKHEDGTDASIDNIKKGQKVLVNPPRGIDFEGHAAEVVLLEMSYKEKYSQLLSHIDGFNIVVMYENSANLPVEMQDLMYENVMSILDGTKHEAVAEWIEYDEDYFVNYKEELNINRFPAILVFDQQGLLFTAYNVGDLYAFFNKVSE